MMKQKRKQNVGTFNTPVKHAPRLVPETLPIPGTLTILVQISPNNPTSTNVLDLPIEFPVVNWNHYKSFFQIVKKQIGQEPKPSPYSELMSTNTENKEELTLCLIDPTNKRIEPYYSNPINKEKPIQCLLILLEPNNRPTNM